MVMGILGLTWKRQEEVTSSIWMSFRLDMSRVIPSGCNEVPA